MSFLFRKKKSPNELAKSVKADLSNVLNADGKAKEKASEELTRHLFAMKDILFGDESKAPKESRCNKLAEELIEKEIIAELILNLKYLDLESKKTVSLIFNNIMRKDLASSQRYVIENKHILISLMEGFEDTHTALHCGSMLRECARNTEICEILIHSDNFYNFLTRYMNAKSFDVSADAFHTFKEMLTMHKSLAASFLEENFDSFFEHYNALLRVEEYITQRQSLKLLGELLLDSANFKIMMKYIGDQENLKLLMTMLRSKRRGIQFEAFHVFKVFVANPHKPAPIARILCANKVKLIEFLKNFHVDKSDDDEHLLEEKAVLIQTLQKLKPLPRRSSKAL